MGNFVFVGLFKSRIMCCDMIAGFIFVLFANALFHNCIVIVMYNCFSNYFLSFPCSVITLRCETCGLEWYYMFLWISRFIVFFPDVIYIIYYFI